MNASMWDMRACERETMNWFTQAIAWDLQTVELCLINKS